MPSAQHPPPGLQSYLRHGLVVGSVAVPLRPVPDIVRAAFPSRIVKTFWSKRSWAALLRIAQPQKHVGQLLKKKQFDAIRSWNPSELPSWLNEKAYRSRILPRLSKFTVKAIRFALGVSHPYATNIRRGTAIPHARHWVPLAKLTGIMSLENSPASVVDSSRASQGTKARLEGRKQSPRQPASRED